MASINPYLNFNGNTEEVFNFYKSVFGGEFLSLQRFKDTPDAENIPADAHNQIMHIALAVGNSVIMGTDAPESMGFKLTTGNNINLSIDADSEADTERIFNGLSVGGKVEMPLAKTFWNAYFGMLEDKFGIHWMVSSDYNKH